MAFHLFARLQGGALIGITDAASPARRLLGRDGHRHRGGQMGGGRDRRRAGQYAEHRAARDRWPTAWSTWW
jgi:hypothetical protein